MTTDEKLDKIIELLSVEKNDLRAAARVKRIDKVGRVSIPISIRRELNINDDDELLVYRSGNKIILEKVLDKQE